MSAQHTSSLYPGRMFGPPYCLSCGQDWPCEGSQYEAAERRALSAASTEKIEQAYQRGFRDGFAAKSATPTPEAE